MVLLLAKVGGELQWLDLDPVVRDDVLLWYALVRSLRFCVAWESRVPGIKNPASLERYLLAA